MKYCLWHFFVILVILIPSAAGSKTCATKLKKVAESGGGGSTHQMVRPENEPSFQSQPPQKPKAEIADYVATFGIRVPRRFETLNEAKETKGSFIIRSEHPIEFASAAGLFRSYRVDLEVPRELLTLSTLSDFRRSAMKYGGKEFAEYLNVDPEKFAAALNYSFWEFLGGFNRSIIADNAIPGRYHIITRIPSSPESNYTMVENNQIILSEPQNLPKILKDSISEDISFYEKIRHLPRFETINCPLVEFQTLNNENYFLQYRHGQTFEERSFVLNRSPKPGEIEASFVRGATQPEGLVSETITMNVTNAKDLLLDNWIVDNYFWTKPLSEFMTKRAQVQIINGSFKNLAQYMPSHLSQSKLFGPKITIILPRDKIKLESFETFRARVVSDGNKAYFQIL